MNGPILAFGASGKFAGLVLPALAARGARVRGFAKTEKDAAVARSNGATEVALGDLTDRESVDRALAGVERVFYIAPAFLPNEAEVGQDVVHACVAAGAERFVFSSVFHPVLSHLSNHAAKAPVEEAVLDSGIDYTFLHPALYFQNYAASWPKIVERGALAEPWSCDTRFSRVDYRDVADVAAMALTEDHLLHGTFELCSEGELNRHDVAALVGEVLGREIRAEKLDLSSLGDEARAMRPMFEHYDRVGLLGNPLTLEAILGRKPMTLRTYFEEWRLKRRRPAEMVDVSVLPFEIETRTRHGDRVRADVYLPERRSGPVPVLLGASPYQKALRRLPATPSVFPFIEYGPMQIYLDEGYAYVAMDVPGTGRSEGKWNPVSRAEGEAIHDMIEHVATQDWAGPIGMSYYCWSQWNAARTRPPSLRCLAAFDGATDMYRDWMYQGGIPIQGFLNSWLYGSVILQHMGSGLLITNNDRGAVLNEMYSHPFDDEWQRRRSPFWELDQVNIPLFSIGAWGKASLHLRGNFEGFRLARGPKQLLITGAQTFAETQRLFFDEHFHRSELLPWYDHHLKGLDNGVMERPAVRFFVHGERQVLEAPDWPPPDATIAELFLCGERSGHEELLNDGSLVEVTPVAGPEVTTWRYPDDKWMAGVTTFDVHGVPHHTARVVTYTTPAFDRDREFTGQGVLHLFASSDQTDMDVMVKLSLLPKDENAPPFVRVTQGWLRASHRAEDPELTTEMRPFLRHDRAEPIEPGVIYELRIELMPMSVLVRQGERLRLEVSNWESAITEAPMTHWYGQKVGADTYHHSPAKPSRLRLHERPRGEGATP